LEYKWSFVVLRPCGGDIVLYKCFGRPGLKNIGVKISEVLNLVLYQLRELCRVRQRNVEKCTKCKIQHVRNLDMVWPGYKSVMKSVDSKTSMALLKEYSVPSNVVAEPFEDIYALIKQVSRPQMTRERSCLLQNKTERYNGTFIRVHRRLIFLLNNAANCNSDWRMCCVSTQIVC